MQTQARSFHGKVNQIYCYLGGIGDHGSTATAAVRLGTPPAIPRDDCWRPPIGVRDAGDQPPHARLFHHLRSQPSQRSWSGYSSALILFVLKFFLFCSKMEEKLLFCLRFHLCLYYDMSMIILFVYSIFCGTSSRTLLYFLFFNNLIRSEISGWAESLGILWGLQ